MRVGPSAFVAVLRHATSAAANAGHARASAAAKHTAVAARPASDRQSRVGARSQSQTLTFVVVVVRILVVVLVVHLVKGLGQQRHRVGKPIVRWRGRKNKQKNK